MPHPAMQRAEALVLRQEPGEQRPEERAEVDPHVEDREAGVAADVVRAVELPDDDADVRLEEARCRAR